MYATVITVLYWNDYANRPLLIREKEESLSNREIELSRRDSMVVDKEICFRELTKLKTIQSSALDILKSYNIPQPNQTYVHNNNQNQINNSPQQETRY